MALFLNKNTRLWRDWVVIDVRQQLMLGEVIKKPHGIVFILHSNMNVFLCSVS